LDNNDSETSTGKTPMSILYVDDDKDDQEIFQEAINTIDSGIKCVTCSKSQEALTILMTSYFNFVFLDFRMQGRDSRDVLKIIRSDQKYERTKIVMYSTYMSDFEKTDCLGLGAGKCIEKSGDFTILCETLKTIIQES
jgi:CheY-like chemotaxis protein